MLRHPYLAAVLEHGTYRALGPRAGADVFPEWHEQPVDLDPVAARQHLLQRLLRLLRRACLHVTPAVHDAPYVDVHADARLVAGDAEREIGAFGSDAGERLQ